MIRVFPRKTNATPFDDKVYFTGPPLVPLDDREVHVSCVFTWDKPKAEGLAEEWRRQGYDVKVGGPAYGDPGGEFVPGRYLKPGYTLTSRGCNNRCWFCYVWKREGNIRELPILDGWRVLDSNLLQCSESHIRAVFAMLQRQPMPVGFLGGLEARILEDWHVDLLATLKLSQCYFAYDTADDYEPLANAAKKVFQICSPASHRICCYVLVGYRGDTFAAAARRIEQVKELGFMPFAMLYRDDVGKRDPKWISFQSQNANPVKIFGKEKGNEFGDDYLFTGTQTNKAVLCDGTGPDLL